MESLYPAIKSSHIFFISASLILFNLRFWLRIAFPKTPLPVALRIVPHINDSCLLLAGMMMMTIVRLSPFQHAWLGVKLLLVAAYIGIGFVSLKNPPRSVKSNLAYVVCMMLFILIYHLARYKPF